jgi:MYXO-CTERM domain-containing protein
MKQTALLASVLALLAPTGVVRAFSEPTLYTEPTVMGGGGGRFFTGAPLDAYTCAVCHEGGERPKVEITGFPDLYEPGKTYQVVVSWTQPSSPHALNLEVVDSDGRAAGKLALPAEDELLDDDRCILSEDEAFRSVQASYLMSYGARTVLGVRGCGARSLHFSFTAPDGPKLALAASVLRADGSEDPKGDGVVEVRQISRRVDDPLVGAVGGSCATGSPQALAGSWAGALAVFLGAWLRRRSARRA